jgi:hypothetical protein
MYNKNLTKKRDQKKTKTFAKSGQPALVAMSGHDSS